MNTLDKHLDRIQEDNVEEISIGEPSLAIAAGVGSAIIITHIALVMLEISDLKRKTKLHPEFTKEINTVLGRKDIKVHVMKNDAPNAFAAGGKYIYLTSGLIRFLTKREIVAVMLHEVGHNEKKHLIKKLAYEYPFYYLIIYLLTMIHTLTPMFILGYLAFKIGIAIARIPYNIIIGRKHEYDADNYATKHGYGDDLISGFKKFEELLERYSKRRQCGRMCKLVERIDRALDEHPQFKDRIERVLKDQQTMKAALSGSFGKIKNAIVKAFK